MTQQKPSAFFKNVLAGVVTMTALGLSPAFAQSDEQSQEQQATVNSTSWGVNCENSADGLQCAASMSLLAQESNQRVFVITFRPAVEGDGLRVVMQLPFGLNLPEGVYLKVDSGDQLGFAIDTCLQAGCFVFEPVDDKLIKSMMAGNNLEVSMQGINGGTTRMMLSLTGFTAAIEKL